MASSCPIETSKDWKQLLYQVGEKLAWITYETYNGYPPQMDTVTNIKKEASIPNKTFGNNLPAIYNRIKQYNKKKGTSHSIKATRIGESEQYNLEFFVNYLPVNFEQQRQREYKRKQGTEKQELAFKETYSSQLPLFSEEEVNYQFKAVSIISENLSKIKSWESNKSIDKATFWTKVQQLGILKDQIELLKESDGTNIEEKLLSFAANYGYSVEINVAKEINNIPDYNSETGEQRFRVLGKNYYQYLDNNGNLQYEENGNPITLKDYKKAYKLYKETEFKQSETPTQYYANMTVPGGTNYTENEIKTPTITPSIKGHAQFSTPEGIMWTRTDEREIYELSDTERLISIMEKSGVLQIKCK